MAMPFILGDYHLSIVLVILIYMVIAVSFRLIATTGEFNFAHVVIMGIGGYTSALLGRHSSVPFWITLPLGGLAGMAFAAITAYPLFRMKGFNFFIGSFAIGEAVRLSWIRWHDLFGGADGIQKIPRPSIGNFTFGTTSSYYWLTLGIVATCLVVLYLIDRSRVGNTLKAIRLNDSLAESLGIDTLSYKTVAYMIGSFFAGISGVLLAHYMGIIVPSQFAVTTMLYVLIWVVVGGTGTFWGPVAGILVLRTAEELLRGALAEWMPMFYGVILIGVVLGLPDGLESVPRRIEEWWKARKC